jgi:hypothetical protein
LEDALREMKLFQDKYYLLKELSEMFEAMLSIQKKVERKLLKNRK